MNGGRASARKRLYFFCPPALRDARAYWVLAARHPRVPHQSNSASLESIEAVSIEITYIYKATRHERGTQCFLSRSARPFIVIAFYCCCPLVEKREHCFIYTERHIYIDASSRVDKREAASLLFISLGLSICRTVARLSSFVNPLRSPD